mmetsp:Transcript_34244/g.77562  ORF Transcript_34244/g.77562 Transcript_34244/m.77562 type:complete len:208 (-) Transcript_34244:111-734(-)
MSMRESKPACSKASSIAMGPAISSTTSTNHSCKFPPCSLSAVTRWPPSDNHSSMPRTGSHCGNSTMVACGQTTCANAATALDVESTNCAPFKSSNEERESSRGIQTTPPGPSATPRAERKAWATVSPGGPCTAAGLAGSTGVSSTATSTFPTWIPLEKYSRAFGSSEMPNVFVGNLGNSGSSFQTSSRSWRQRSGHLNMSTSRCAAA